MSASSFFQFKSNSGVVECRNFAISKSKGDYYCFLDSDDIWDNNKLELYSIINHFSVIS